jgi:hypothetical protein
MSYQGASIAVPVLLYHTPGFKSAPRVILMLNNHLTLPGIIEVPPNVHERILNKFNL